MRQAHRQSWITESDFQLMAAAGINSIRFGVGWWVLAQTAAECTPMVEGGYQQVSAGARPSLKPDMYDGLHLDAMLITHRVIPPGLPQPCIGGRT